MLYRLYGVKGTNGYQYYVGINELSEISIKGLERFCKKKEIDVSLLDLNSFEESILVYDSETKIVYYKFDEEKCATGVNDYYKTFTGYMSPYISYRGEHCYYDDFRVKSL